MPLFSLQWRHNERDGVSNHQPHHCLLNSLFRRRSKKTPKLRVTGLCAGNSPVTGEFPTQMASNAENISIWWRHHVPACPSGMMQYRRKCLGRVLAAKVRAGHYYTCLGMSWIGPGWMSSPTTHDEVQDHNRATNIDTYTRWIENYKRLFWWLSARLQYLHCVSSGDAAVLH